MKRIFSVIIILAMVCSLSSSAFAAPNPVNSDRVTNGTDLTNGAQFDAAGHTLTVTAPNTVFVAGGDITTLGTGDANAGTLTFSGSGTTQKVGTLANAISTINAGIAASTVNFNDAVFATTLAVAGGGNVNLNANATLSTITANATASNISFTGGTTAVTNNANLLNTGSVTFGDGGDTLNFTGGVTHTAGANSINGNITATNAAINLNNTTTVGGNSTLAAGNGLITLGATTLADSTTLTLGTGGSGGATVASIAGTAGGTKSNVTFNTTGVVTSGAVGTDIGTLTVTNSGGTTFSGAVGGSGDRITTVALANTTGTIAFNGNLYTTTLTAAAGAGGYGVALNGTNTDITNAVTFNNAGSVAFGNGGGNTLTFTGGVTHTAGTNSINGNITATDAVINLGNTTAVGGNSTLAAGTGLITLGATTLADSTTLTLGTGGSGGVTVASIAGTAAGTKSNVTFNTTGAVNVAGTVGTDIGTLAVTNSGGTTFDNTVNAATITITDSVAASTVAFQGNTTATSGMSAAAGTGAYKVSMTGALNSIAGDTSFLNTGLTTIGTAGGTSTFAGGLSAVSAGGVHIAGTVATTDTHMDLGATTLTAASALQSGAGTMNVASVNNGGFLLTINDAAAGSATVNGIIIGGGGLTKNGAGTLILNGADTYTGTTNINTGTVVVNNASALGQGAIANVNNGAVLNIGGNTLNIGGTYIENGASTLMVNVNGTAVGSIVSGGTATVLATDKLILAVSNYAPSNTVYTIINGAAGGAIVAPIVTVTGDTHSTYTVTGIGDNLVLTSSRASNGFQSEATSSNGAAVGAVLDNVTNPSADMLTVLNALTVSSPSQVAQSENSMYPTNDGAITQSSEAMLNSFTNNTMTHLDNVRKTGGATGVATGDDYVRGIDVWAQGLGDYAHQDPRGSSNGYNATSWGISGGADKSLYYDQIRVGLGSGYGQTFVNSKDFSGNTSINSVPATLYCDYANNKYPFYIDAAFTFIYNMYNGSRQVMAGPTILRTANADYDGEQYSGYLEGGYSFFYKKLSLTPLASFQYMHLHTGSYTETNAGALDLSVTSQDYDMAQTGLGAKLAYPLDMKYGTLTPDFHFKWLYDWVGDNQASTASFAGGGASFGTNGFNPAQSEWDLGAKLDFKTKYNVTVGLDYDFLMKTDYYEHYGTVDVKYSF